MALFLHRSSDYNGVSQMTYGEREPFVINGPGDYEVKDIFIKGVMSNASLDGKKYINTIYTLSLDGINMVFLGALSDANLSKDAMEAIESPDIIFTPIGGKDSLDAKTSARLIASLEPKLVIPMNYDEASLRNFLKEMGE